MDKYDKWKQDCIDWCTYNPELMGLIATPVPENEGDILIIYMYSLSSPEESKVVYCNYWYPGEYTIYDLQINHDSRYYYK